VFEIRLRDSDVFSVAKAVVNSIHTAHPTSSQLLETFLNTLLQIRSFGGLGEFGFREVKIVHSK